MIQSGVNQMIGLALLAKSHVDKVNIGKETNKQLGNISQQAGEINKQLGNISQQAGETGSDNTQPSPVKESNSDNTQEPTGNGFAEILQQQPQGNEFTEILQQAQPETARQIAMNSVQQDVDAKNFTQNNIKSNYTSEEAFNRMKETLTYFANANIRDDRGFYANRSVRRDAKKVLKEIDGGNE